MKYQKLDLVWKTHHCETVKDSTSVILSYSVLILVPFSTDENQTSDDNEITFKTEGNGDDESSEADESTEESDYEDEYELDKEETRVTTDEEGSNYDDRDIGKEQEETEEISSDDSDGFSYRDRRRRKRMRKNNSTNHLMKREVKYEESDEEIRERSTASNSSESEMGRDGTEELNRTTRLLSDSEMNRHLTEELNRATRLSDAGNSDRSSGEEDDPHKKRETIPGNEREIQSSTGNVSDWKQDRILGRSFWTGRLRRRNCTKKKEWITRWTWWYSRWFKPFSAFNDGEESKSYFLV